MTPDPIIMDCEGSGRRGCAESADEVMCSMCGEWWPALPLGGGVVVAPHHARRDIIAMIKRGDFG